MIEADLLAYVDGRLAEGRRAEVEAYLSERPEEAARIAAYRTQNAALAARYAPVLDEPIPERLSRAARPRAALPLRYVATLGWMLLGAALGWQLHASLATPTVAAPQAVAIARHAAIAHATYSPEVRHPVEVGADQEAHLVAWLSKRLGARVRAPKLEPAGFSLVGGRLLPGEPGPVAQFMYQGAQGARVTLYVRTSVVENTETAFRYADEGKVRVFYWIDRTYGYALSSADVSKEELLQLAHAAYAQLSP